MDRTKRQVATVSALVLCLVVFLQQPAGGETFSPRPPAVPLVTHDPYFSIWSASDRLTDSWPRHWTGRPQPMAAMVRVDGGPIYRLMGPAPRQVPAMTQTNLRVYPTRSVYTFKDDGLEITLSFISPLLIRDLEILARPVSYVSVSARSVDGRPHRVSLYFDAGAEIAVNEPSQKVVWSRLLGRELEVLSFGSQEQPVLAKKGDDLRIDWGYFYLAAPKPDLVQSCLAGRDECRSSFLKSGRLPEADDMSMPVSLEDGHPVAALLRDFGEVGAAPVSRFLMLAYDDQFSIEYFYRKLRPYWRRHGAGAGALLSTAAADYPQLEARCREFDEKLMADMTEAGGERYAFIGALAYRQSLAAHKLAADRDGSPLFFPKENFSNGCISTVDVIYPEAPMYALLNPELLRALIVPVLDYARSGDWPFPFAPHDLGTYPQANGQVYGGGNVTEEDQMPVEESGNMLLLAAALAQGENSADLAVKYWNLLSRWADYLKKKGLDPENQLCTDDFAGHLAHNANLSLKAILGLRAYADLCERTGKTGEAGDYSKTAAGFAAQWQRLADDGDHFRLAFDKPGTWSQKYNLVWDKVLGYNLFPPEVAAREVAFYRKVQLPFGLPLDNRKEYTKLDWLLWTATLAGAREDFDRLVGPVYDFLNKTPDRVPMTDWYGTADARKVGFQARPVVGGVFVKLLADPGMRAKWAMAGEKSGPDGARVHTQERAVKADR
jgi:hypothetical protein